MTGNLLDGDTLAKMAAEIAVLLRERIPSNSNVVLQSEVVDMKSKTYAQVFAFKAGHQGVFLINAELRRPPPDPGNLNLKCITSK